MKKIKLFVILVVFLFPMMTIANTSATENLSNLLQGMKTYSANFIQVVGGATNNSNLILPAGFGDKTSSGKVYIQNPGKFRWQVLKPESQELLTVANPKNVTTYNKALEQALIKPTTEIAMQPAAFLSGSLKSLDAYNVVQEGEQYTLTIKQGSNSQIQKINLLFDGKKLIAMELKMGGEDVKVKFSDVKLNESIPASLFNFVPPKGVDIIKE